jgi:hypothetical protein
MQHANLALVTGMASPWTHGFSPEGHAYYFNTVTGESSWTAPPEHRSSDVSAPLTPSMGAAGTTDVSDLFGPGSDGDSELFGAGGAPVDTPFTGAMGPNAYAGFRGGATESSSELFGGKGAPDFAGFASAPAPAASELFGSAPDAGPGLFASAPAPAASELFGSAPDAGPGLFASAPAPAASELFGSAPDAGPGLFASAPYDAARVAFVVDPFEAPVPPTPEVGQGYVAHRVQQLVAPPATAPAAAVSVPPADAASTDPNPDQGPWMFGYSEQARRIHPCCSRPDSALPDPNPDPSPDPAARTLTRIPIALWSRATATGATRSRGSRPGHYLEGRGLTPRRQGENIPRAPHRRRSRPPRENTLRVRRRPSRPSKEG